MSAKRKSTGSVINNNFRPQNEFQKRGETKGNKPLPAPESVGRVLLTMIIHGCRKVVFVNTYIKIAVYLGIIFLSFLWDFSPLPRSYFSKSSNSLNQYFVKWGWAWTLILTVPFVVITSFTYCCGKRRMVGWHLARIGVATAVWFIFTKSFVYIENTYGKCSIKSDKFLLKSSCLAAGHFWHSLDISGHAFILIYSCLVIIEEAKVIVGWETIDDLIRNEEHLRTVNESDLSSPLKNLTHEELYILRFAFKKFSPYVRGIFVAMTILICLWDIMILSTALYFHIMIEKLLSALLAVAVWYFTYNMWFRSKILPYSPGVGVFQYNKKKATNGFGKTAAIPTSKGRPDIPSFMGMPIYGNRSAPTAAGEDDELNVSRNSTSGRYTSPQVARTGPITRSQSSTKSEISLN